jgi:drug/metabolite transporter (DMT)-like permease
MADDGPSGSLGAGHPVREVDLRAYVYLALMVLIGSSTAPAARYAVRELPVGLVPLIRFGVAGLCLLPVVLRQGGGARFRRMVREDGWRLAVAALLCIPLNQTFFLNAARLTPTSHVALIYAACPLVVLVLAVLLGQEQLVPGRVVGVVTSVLGIVVIGFDSLWRGGATGQATLRGDLLLIGAVVSWGAYLTVSKRLIIRHGPLTTLAGTFLLGTLLHLPVALVTLPGWAPLSLASASAWRGLAFLTLVATLVGLAFQNLAMKRLDASQVSTFGNASPVLTVVWGIWLFGESVTPALAIGGALTLGGIFLTCSPPRSYRSSSTREIEVEVLSLQPSTPDGPSSTPAVPRKRTV